MFNLSDGTLKNLFTSLLVVGLSMPVSAPAQPLQGIYTCTDATGRKLTSDRPILACIDREQKVIGPSGTVKFIVSPTLTAHEQAQLEARKKAKLGELARLEEEKRRDRTLLMRYPSKAVHDNARAEVVAQIGLARQAALRRVDAFMRQRSRLDTEMEFYKKNPAKAPPILLRQIEDVNQSLALQGRFIADQDAETRRLNARFDEELVLLNRLWAQMPPSPLAGASKAH